MIRNKFSLLLLLFLTIFIIFFFQANISLSKYDKYIKFENGTKHHGILKEAPLFHTFIEAQKFKQQLSNKQIDKDLYDVGYKSHFLPQKILGIYAYVFNIDFFEEDFSNLKFDNKNQNVHDIFTVKPGGKILYLIFQKFLYLLVCLYFFLTLSKKIKNSNIPIFITIFLLIEPTINQYHLTFYGESVFFSLLILLLTLVINLPKNNLHYIWIGFFLVIMTFQRSISLFMPIIITVLIAISFKWKSINKISIMLSTYIFLILVMGYSNYKKTENFYFLPWQTKSDLFDYFIPNIIKHKEKISANEANDFLNKKKIEFLKERNLDTDTANYNLELLDFKQKYALKVIFENKALTIKTFFKNSAHSTLLNPFEQKYKSKFGSNYYKNEQHQKQIKLRIFYSLILYSVVIFGLIKAIMRNYVFSYSFLLISLYIFTISTWVGYTRYFVPVLLPLSIFFAIGCDEIKKYKDKCYQR